MTTQMTPHDYYDYLAHYGVLGMKWGVRKDRDRSPLSRNWAKAHERRIKTKSGDTISLKQQPASSISLFLAKYFKRMRQDQEKTANYDIVGSDSKKVGDLQLYRESKDSMNIVWIGTNESSRGKGYASAVMKSTIAFAKNELNLKQLTLEVPGSSPDARHIYEKYGFKVVKTLTSDDVWGGLTAMKLDLDDVKLKHSDSDFSLYDKEKFLKYLSAFIEKEEEKMRNDELAHYGVLGMKWGVRRDKRILAARTGRKAKSISDEEARQYRKDVTTAKQYGSRVRGITKKDPRTGTDMIVDYKFENSRGVRLGKEYGRAIQKQAAFEQRLSKIMNSAALYYGTQYAAQEFKRARYKKRAAEVLR